ncbi:hypothetical protein CBS147352_10986 [Aspergillus niger]|nr:hypothetical protein CBS147324_10994 [Aspergillus niger]KAI3037534.1 hypothetical protein CBS147352_10986 [Aspergillus niger]
MKPSIHPSGYTGAVVEILILGDFNRQDQLWGGDDVSLRRQGEADPIIDLMNECALSSLLKRGTETWHGGGYSGDCESTIDLVLASDNLTDSVIKCAILGTEHGSDHCAVETVFDAPWSLLQHQGPLLLKNAPWKEINARIANTLAATLAEGTVQQKTDRLLSAVSEAVHAYLKSGEDAAFGKIPQLLRADETTTTDHTEQAEELLAKFFPPLPDNIDDEGTRLQRAPVEMLAMTIEEIERRLMAAKSWKAPGENGLPAIVWKMTWPTVKYRVLDLFQASLEEGTLPRQWRHAKIIPLKKPNKENYTIAKAWRPVSLLATLGKVLESVVAERISRGGDSRFAPDQPLRWVEAFCPERTAAIQINGQLSEVHSLPQAGLPQGSPLSPILFLFFNADIVQRQIDSQGGAIAFVDDLLPLGWEKRSGATFEADKTAIIHFTPKAYKSDKGPFTVKGQTVEPKDHVKILGVIMDARLKYKEHIARAASKCLEAAMELRRLRGLSPATARQLFTSTVAPVVDYASNVWMHAFKIRPRGRSTEFKGRERRQSSGPFSPLQPASRRQRLTLPRRNTVFGGGQ